MGVKIRIFAGLVIFLVLMAGPVGAISTRAIDSVRSKDVLSRADFEVIDEFVAGAVGELLEMADFTSISKGRTAILIRSKSATESAAAQYSEQFSESAYKHISEGLRAAKSIEPYEDGVKVIVSFLILIDGLEETRLADLAIEKLNDKETIVRYWAAHCLTNKGIIKRLNSEGEGNSRLAKKIAVELGKLVDDASPEVLALMLRFADEAETPRAEDLLLWISDARINRYSEWKVDYELLDSDVLKALYKRMAGVSDSVIARRFGQLYSYVMQRYMRGQDYLSDSQKVRLASVLVEIEKSCIGKILEMPQSVIQKAVEQKDMRSLSLEYRRLFGDETKAGQLALKLGFDYGKGSNGEKYISPLSLPGPPKSL